MMTFGPEERLTVRFMMTLMKGIKSFRLPRHFVAFILQHPVASAFLSWYPILPKFPNQLIQLYFCGQEHSDVHPG